MNRLQRVAVALLVTAWALWFIAANAYLLATDDFVVLEAWFATTFAAVAAALLGAGGFSLWRWALRRSS